MHASSRPNGRRTSCSTGEGGAVAPNMHRRYEDGARYGHRIGWRSSGERSAGCSSFLSARWQNAAFAGLVNLGRKATPGHELLKYGAWGAWPGSLWREGLASSGAAKAGSHTWICLPVSADRPEDHALFWGQRSAADGADPLAGGDEILGTGTRADSCIAAHPPDCLIDACICLCVVLRAVMRCCHDGSLEYLG